MAHAGLNNEPCDLKFSDVFIDMLLPGRGFLQESIEFRVCLFDIPMGIARTRVCITSRLS